MTTLVMAEGIFPWKEMPVWITPKMRMPMNVPATNPTPPLRSVPPTTTAAIASSSRPVAAIALPAERSAV